MSIVMMPNSSTNPQNENPSSSHFRPIPKAPAAHQNALRLSSLAALKERKRKEFSPVQGSDTVNVVCLPKRQRHPICSTQANIRIVEDEWLLYAEQVTPAKSSPLNRSRLSRPPFKDGLQPGQFEDKSNDSECVGVVSEEELIDSITAILENICSINNGRIAIPLPVGGARAPYISATFPDGSSSIFFSLQKPAVNMRYYVHRLVKYLHVSSSVFIVALIYLDRVHAADEILALTDLNVHRLITTALALACKFLEDEVHRNSTVCRIGGIPTTAEMNLLESQFLRRINWECSVSVEAYHLYKENIFKRLMIMPREECPSSCSESPAESDDSSDS